MEGGGEMVRDKYETKEEEEEVEVMMTMNSLKGRPPRKSTIANNGNGDGLSLTHHPQHHQVVTVEEEEEEKLESNGNEDHYQVAVAADDVPNNDSTATNKELEGEDQVSQSHSSLNSVYLDRAEGAESTNGTNGINNQAADGCADEKAPIKDELDFDLKNPETEKGLASGTNHHGNLKDVGQIGLHFLLSENPSENGNASFKPVSKHVNLGAVEESGQEVAEWDVERVIEEQETHDLYCPNCNSCITKRVILRKRKRKVSIIENGKKRERPETPIQSGLDADPSASASYGEGHSTVTGSSVSADALGTNDREPDTGPDIFRCLSCFSFFIPTVAGFKRIFGVKDEGVNTQNPKQTPPRSTGTGQQGNNLTVQPSVLGVSLPSNSLLPSKGPVNGGEVDSRKEEKDVVVSSDRGKQLLEEAKVGETPDGTKTKNADENNGSSSTLSTTYPFIEQSHASDQVKVSMGKHTEDGQNDIVLSMQGAALLLETDTKYKNEAAGKTIDRGVDVILLVQEEPVAGASPSLQNPAAPVIPPVSEIEASVAEQGVVTPKRSSEWDILKSIVYGGLFEVITSLGVVSSAAGGDAKTLNIVAFGVANLVSGFLIIIHSLWELKNEQHGRITEVEEQKVDRYEQVLGRRNNFRRHAVFAVLSYLVFGLLPPITYGFSFRKSDNKEYKLITVAAVSLVCIILLATGKVQTRKPPKSYIKTIMYFVSIGVMASGLSYVFGELIKELLEKLALFEPSAVAPVPPSSAFLQTIPSSAKPAAWASY